MTFATASNQVEFAYPLFCGAAARADAADDQPVAGHAELVFAGNGFAEFEQFVAGEFDQLVAFGAMQVIVLGVAVIVFVDRPAAKDHGPQQAGFDHFGQRAVDRGPADFFAARFASQIQQQLVGIEMFVPGGNLLHQSAPLLRNSLAAGLQVFLEPLDRRESNFDSAEGKVLRHGRHEGARDEGLGTREKQQRSATTRCDQSMFHINNHSSLVKFGGKRQMRGLKVGVNWAAAHEKPPVGPPGAGKHRHSDADDLLTAKSDAESTNDQGQGANFSRSLADFVQQPIERDIHFVVGHVRALRNGGFDGVDAVPTDVGNFAQLAGHLRGRRKLQLVGRVDRRSRRRRSRRAIEMWSVNALGTVQLADTLNIHD